jgi:hypothetical protein
MEIALDRVTLSDARPELIWNLLTGGSNSIHSLSIPLRRRGDRSYPAAPHGGGPVRRGHVFAIGPR